MTDKQISMFKHQLIDSKEYKKRIKQLKSEISDLEYQKKPYISPQFDKPVSFTASKQFYPYEKLERIDQMIEKRQNEINAYRLMLKKTEMMLNLVKDTKIRVALVEIYEKGRKSSDVSKELGYNSAQALHKAIKDTLRRIRIEF